MGKIIPFKAKQSAEEKPLREKMRSNPDDLETLAKLLILKIQEGKFDPKSDYAEGILGKTKRSYPPLTYMLREIYDKQAAFFEVIKENHGSIENLINQNTEMIRLSLVCAVGK